MKAIRLGLLGGLMTAAIAAVGFQEGTILRRELREGAKDTYTFSFKTTQKIEMDSSSGAPAGMFDEPIEVSATAMMGFVVGKLNAETKKADLNVSMTDFKLDMGRLAGMMGNMPELPKEIKMTAQIDDRNRVSNLKMPDVGMAGNMLMNTPGSNPMGSMFIEFPEQSVKVGDSWKIRVPGNPATGNKEVEFNAKLLSDTIVDGKPRAVVGLEGTINIDGDLSEMMKDTPQGGAMNGMKVLVKAIVGIKGQATIDKATGRTLKMDMDMDSKQNLEMPDMGMKMKINGISRLKLDLVPPKP